MKTLSLIYYSPTGTTQKIVKEIGENIELKIISEINIAKKDIESIPYIPNDCLTIIGMPVYGGRLPINVVDSLKKLQSNKSPVVIVVVYGNRDYDDSLLELKDVISSSGFKVIAGAAFIGEHSFSTNEKPISQNRPDKLDLEKCRAFSRIIIEKIKDDFISSNINIPGTFPYKERKFFPSTVHPETNYAKCNQCEVCIELCPTNALSIQGQLVTNGELCTACCACVKACPENARTFDNPTVNSIKERLFNNCSSRKEPEFFV